MPVQKPRRKPRAEIGAEEARKTMRDVLNRAEFGGERIIITRNEKPSAALVPIADLEKIEAA